MPPASAAFLFPSQQIFSNALVPERTAKISFFCVPATKAQRKFSSVSHVDGNIVFLRMAIWHAGVLMDSQMNSMNSGDWTDQIVASKEVGAPMSLCWRVWNFVCEERGRSTKKL